MSLVPPIVFASLAVLCGMLLVVERAGVRTTLTLSFKGDVKRETRFIAQYGQAVCTVVAAVLVLQLDGSRGKRVFWPLVVATFGVSLLCTVVKRLTGRVRPDRENAGRFLGPSWKHANYRESFPSSHSANAVALSAVLAAAYPPAAATFWTLALLCAGLRYILDAHWPSDVVAGIAAGYLAARVTWWAFGVG